jgi:phage terminase large subunit-like protein
MPRDRASLERTPATSTNSLDWVPDPVEIYARRVLAGDIIAGPLVRAACTRHLHDLEHGSARGLVWRAEKAIRAINFFADVLRLPQVEVDKVSGEQLIDASMSRPFVLHLSQQFIVGSLFGWYNEDGTRRFRTAFVEIGKGNGKSPLAAGIGLYMLTADGQANAEVYASAAVKDQAKIQYRDAVNMVDASEDLLEILEKHGEKEVYNLVNRRTKGFFKPISAEKRGLDGKRVHCSLIDELHEHPSSIVADKMRAGTKGMRNALVFEITNSGFDRTSVCYQHHEYSERVVLGEGIDDSWFAYVCGLDVGDDPLVDEGCWPKANPLLEVTIAPRYLRELVREARGMPAKASIVKRLNFCVWVDAENPAIDQELWRAAEADFDDEVLAGAECLGALDLSGIWDLTALALLWRVGELVYLVVEFWTPKEGLLARAKRDRVPWDLWVSQGFITATPGRSVDYRFVASAWASCSSASGCSAWRSIPTGSNTSSGSSSRPGSSSSSCRTGRASSRRPSRASGCRIRSRSSRSCSRNPSFAFGRNPALAYAAASAVHEADPKGNRVYTKKRSRGRIDGVVALAMVCGLAETNEGERRSRTTTCPPL